MHYLTGMRNLILLLPFILFSCTPESGEATAAETMTDPPVAMAAAPTPDSLLRHAVLFSFKEDSYPAGVAAVEAAFRALPGKIPEIHSFEWGTNNSPENLAQGYTHMFFLTFLSEADRAVYLPHPAHKAFGEVLGPHLDQVLVLDYWAQQ